MTKRITSILLIITIISVVLAGCTPSAPPSGAPTNTPSASPSTTPSPSSPPSTSSTSPAPSPPSLNFDPEPDDQFTYEFGAAIQGEQLRFFDNKIRQETDRYGDPIDSFTTGMVLTRYHGSKTQLRVPDDIEGIPVIGITGTCFDTARVTDVLFPDTLLFFTWGDNSRNPSEQLPETYVIPYGVTEISYMIGYWQDAAIKVRSVTIPDTVTVLSNDCFNNFNSLASIVIPPSVEYIGDYAFGSRALLRIEMSDNFRYVGTRAFTFTSWNAAQPDGIIYAGNIAIGYKGDIPPDTHLTFRGGTIGFSTHFLLYNEATFDKLTIPDTVTRLSENCFYGASFNTLELGAGVTHIERGAFTFNTLLTGVFFGDNVTYIGEEAFYGNSSLTTVLFGDNLTYIDNGAFYNCPNLDEPSKARILAVNPDARF